MQIFATDISPVYSVINLDDKRVNSSILESSILIASALNMRGIPEKDLPVHPGWFHHPLTKWAADNHNNIFWLNSHLRALLCEFFVRHTSKQFHVYRQHDRIYENHIYYVFGSSKNVNYYDIKFHNCTVYKQPEYEDISIHYKYKMHLAYKWSIDKRTPKWSVRGMPKWYKEYLGKVDNNPTVEMQKSFQEKIALENASSFMKMTYASQA